MVVQPVAFNGAASSGAIEMIPSGGTVICRPDIKNKVPDAFGGAFSMTVNVAASLTLARGAVALRASILA